MVAKPGRIKHPQVERVQGDLVTTAECVASQPDGQRAAFLQLRRLRNDLLQWQRVTQVAIDGMQAGRSARRVVRLRQDIQRQLLGDIV